MQNAEFYSQDTVTQMAGSGANHASLPDKIGPYKIESLLSSGGMSLLYLGKQEGNNKLLAVKVLSPKYVSNQEMIAQFLKEAEIIGLTDHPNIVSLYGQGEWEGGLYIAMDFVQGISLRQFIVQHSLSLRRSLDIVLQVAYALLHLHTHGVVHRDLKPENILITESGAVKVIDFGIAQLSADDSAKRGSGTFLGTPSYMSPEQKENPLNAGYTSDIYALGVIAYELLIGKLSFGNIQLNMLPKNLRAIITKALAPKPHDRYHDIVDLITEISNYLKTNTHMEERSTEDELKEVLEVLAHSQRTMLPPHLPTYLDLEIGVAKAPGSLMLGVFYDFYRLPNGDEVVLIAESESKEIDATVYTAYLKGMVRMSLHEEKATMRPFDLVAFVTNLNDKLCDDEVPATFRFNALHLNPREEALTFISCGFHSVWHKPNGGSNPKLIVNRNPSLGKERGIEYMEARDSWYIGDMVVMHTFNEDNLEESTHKRIEEEVLNAMSSGSALSTSAHAEHIFKQVWQNAPTSVQKGQKVVMSIQRID